MAEKANSTNPSSINRRGFLGHLIGGPLAVAAVYYGTVDASRFDYQVYIDRWAGSDPYVVINADGRVVAFSCWSPEIAPNGWDDLPLYIEALRERGLIRQI